MKNLAQEQDLLARAHAKKKENRKLVKQLRKQKPNKLDEAFQILHEEVFEEIDCLSCANCCKTTSPVFTERDISRLAKSFRMKPSQFVEAYLYLDDEEDYVLQQAPCPFLGDDNYCSIYDIRPKACRDYPHTQRKNIYKRLNP
jgi:Fe-S-cluster containining protein